MINVAMVEDNDFEADVLQSYIEKFQKENAVKISLTRFKDAATFLVDYRHNFDLVFMDIELPNLNGMDAARRLRDIDKQIVIMFVTNMAKFAVKGYEVNALDYIIKPLKYNDFIFKLQKALDFIQDNVEAELVINQQGGIARISTRTLQFVEVSGHKLSYYTGSEVINGTGTLTKLENDLSKFNFLRCNNCYLINPKYIQKIKGRNITMRNGSEVQISYPRKKQFMEDLAKWLGQGNFV